MSNGDLIVGLEQLSCLLSIFGSLCVALTWAYPFENRAKHGRILLLWLSITDGISSLVYFLQTLGISSSVDFCKVMALLGIFFPVASFLWTDFIAFYLYLAVMRRQQVPINWQKLLRIFHIIAWSVSLFIIILVAAFNHAGKSSQGGDDDIIYSNTGGWCWITGNNNANIFVWELIGGKIVEWTSCLIILPFLYGSVCFKLRGLDHSTPIHTSTDGAPNNRLSTAIIRRNSNKSPNNHKRDSFDTNAIAMNNMVENNGTNTARMTSPVASPSTLPGNTSIAAVDHSTSLRPNNHSTDDNSNSGMGPSGTGQREKYACEDDSIGQGGASSASHSNILRSSSADESSSVSKDFATSSSSNIPAAPIGSPTTKTNSPVKINTVHSANNTVMSANTTHVRSRNNSIHSNGTNKGFFSKFYLKLFALPLVFLFIRFWGSMRIILTYANYENHAVTEFFAIMQAFFDPSQGFFNALLFVFTSKEDRFSLYLSFAMITSFLSNCMPCCADISECFASSTAVNKQKKLASRAGINSSTVLTNNNNPLIHSTSTPSGDDNADIEDQMSSSQSMGNISLSSDILSDYDCDDTNRLSGFSFDSRMDSLY